MTSTTVGFQLLDSATERRLGDLQTLDAPLKPPLRPPQHCIEAV